ncbi:sensor histidine kinase [Hydrogenophaga crassostreae]|uniref:sensor histidine kinase n=1 Tax=Hydrogenophaga crassostreae TaxID=1763535 RepID=UPI0012FCA214|nr:HAMP domain-containing sensor histidine kinase [Hydrogenophaga crassostreae]
MQRYLLRWTLGAVLVVWLTLLAVAWGTGLRESRKFSDGQLVSVARLWLQTVPASQAVVDPALLDGFQHEYLQDVAVMDWQDGQLVIDSHQMAPGLNLANIPVHGFASVPYQTPQSTGERRLYTVALQQNGHQRRVVVLMDMQKRSELGKDIAEHVAQPALLIFPLVTLLLWWAIRRGLRPLDQLSSEVAALDGFSGQRMDAEHRFREFNSTVLAINTLVDSLQKQAQRERDFASDVAHELRTPLAAMTLLASAAQANPTPERLTQLEHESLRAGRILAQLLDLARAQRAGASGRHAGQALASVDVGEVALQLVSSHAQKAHDTEHELSLSRPDTPVTLAVAPLLLELALRNLIDNALQHTPPHTQVGVEVEQTASEIRVSVSDDGQQRQTAGASADRGGMGLGLRLVERIAEEMGATLLRDQGVAPMGTRFTLRWPIGQRGAGRA